MFERLRQRMVESFVGAIALGYLLAQGILYFVDIFSAPVRSWVARSEYPGFTGRATVQTGLLLRDAFSDLVTSFVLLLIWYLLLRWLFLKPLKEEAHNPTPNPEQTA
jgi:hypothetical protein